MSVVLFDCDLPLEENIDFSRWVEEEVVEVETSDALSDALCMAGIVLSF